MDMHLTTTERWARSTKKRFSPNVWHLIDGTEEYNDDILVARCAKRLRVSGVEQADQPSTVGLTCVLCARYRHAKPQATRGGKSYRPMFA